MPGQPVFYKWDCNIPCTKGLKYKSSPLRAPLCEQSWPLSSIPPFLWAAWWAHIRQSCSIQTQAGRRRGFKVCRPTAAPAGFTQRTDSSRRTSLKNSEYLNRHRGGAGCDFRAADRKTGWAEALACSQEDEGEPDEGWPLGSSPTTVMVKAQRTQLTSTEEPSQEDNEPVGQPLDPGDFGNELCTSARVRSQESKHWAPVMLTFNSKQCSCISLNNMCL